MKIQMGKKYRTINGNDVEILRCGVIIDSIHRAIGLVEIGTGRYQLCTWTDNGYCTLEGNNLVEVSPYDDFKIDDHVIVWINDFPQMKKKRYFAGIDENGRPQTFTGGTTSWTSIGKNSWDNCIKAED